MIVALAGQKGGTGKSTLAIAIASEWHRKGKKTLLVDADPQKTSLTWAAVAAEESEESPTVVAMGAGLHKADQLPALADSFERVVIDCPPRHDEIQRAALMVADLVILPCGPGAFDAWALAETLDLVSRARQLRPDLEAVVVINKKVARTSVAAEAREALGGCGLRVLDTEVGLRVAFQEAPSAGRGPTTYEPKSAASKEIKKLTREIERLIHGKK